jgi:hypothetical protein
VQVSRRKVRFVSSVSCSKLKGKHGCQDFPDDLSTRFRSKPHSKLVDAKLAPVPDGENMGDTVGSLLSTYLKLEKHGISTKTTADTLSVPPHHIVGASSVNPLALSSRAAKSSRITLDSNAGAPIRDSLPN